MENFKLEVYFHAENREDAETQARHALDAFDDGFDEAWISGGADWRTQERILPSQLHPKRMT